MNIEEDDNEQVFGMAAGYNMFEAGGVSMSLTAGVNKEIQEPISSQEFFNKACKRAQERLESEIEQPIFTSNIGQLN